MSRGAITTDAQQQAYAFLVGQLQHLEAEVYRRPYAHIRYPELVPVDTSANPYVQGITYFSAEGYGTADFIGKGGTDFPTVSTSRDQHSVLVEAVGSSYIYDMFTLETARLLGQDLPSEHVNLVRRVMEEKIDDIVLNGDSDLGWNALWDFGTIHTIDAPDGAGGTSNWSSKTSNEILADIHSMQNRIFTQTKNVVLPDTLLLPPTVYSYIVGTPLNDTATISIHDYIKQANILTASTGQELMIRAIHGLESAGDQSPTTRAVFYKRDPMYLKLHLPMPVRFLPLFQTTPTQWQHAAMFRTGGLEVRLPYAFVYMDGI